MTWLGWVLVADLGLSAGVTVSRIGKVRTQRDAAWGMVEIVALIVGILVVGTGHL
jgi:hypothetical protein